MNFEEVEREKLLKICRRIHRRKILRITYFKPQISDKEGRSKPFVLPFPSPQTFFSSVVKLVSMHQREREQSTSTQFILL